jgi:hypothetical protein
MGAKNNYQRSRERRTSVTPSHSAWAESVSRDGNAIPRSRNAYARKTGLVHAWRVPRYTYSCLRAHVHVYTYTCLLDTCIREVRAAGRRRARLLTCIREYMNTCICVTRAVCRACEAGSTCLYACIHVCEASNTCLYTCIHVFMLTCIHACRKTRICVARAACRALRGWQHVPVYMYTRIRALCACIHVPWALLACKLT